MKTENHLSPKTFIEGLRYTDIADMVSSANGLEYLAWPTAIALAGRPQLDVVTFDNNKPYLDFFGGGVVAVEGMSGERKQRIWLPIMNNRHESIVHGKIDVRDINDSLSRCRAKTVAMLHGVGLSLYAGYGGNSIGFLKNLGVKPDSDLSQVEPLVAQKPGKAAASYVDWVAAYTAAKLTDPDFFFEVLGFKNIDMETGEEKIFPAQQVGLGWMVAVKLIYKGQEHVEWLPIMGTKEVQTKNGIRKMDHQPLDNPTTHDWNRSVMRCLTRGIAVLTGYGLSVYAKEDYMLLTSMNNDEVVTNEEPKHKVVESTKQTTAASNETEASGILGAIDDKVPEDHFLYEPDEKNVVNEPSEQIKLKMLNRINAIRSLDSIGVAKRQIDEDYAGTLAHAEFLRALSAKREQLREANLTAV